MAYVAKKCKTLFFHLDHSHPAATSLNANSNWVDYKFIHVPRKGCDLSKKNNSLHFFLNKTPTFKKIINQTSIEYDGAGVKYSTR